MRLDKIQRAWSQSYLNGSALYWSLTAFLLCVVAFKEDSILRDFVLLFGIIALGLTSAFLNLAIKQIMYRPARAPQEESAGRNTPPNSTP